MKTMLISGGIAGLVAIGPLLGDPQFHRYTEQFPTTLGFTGIAVALVGRNHPVGIAFAALLFAYIERATQVLALQNIPQEISKIMQGSIILSSVIAYEIVRGRASRPRCVMRRRRPSRGPPQVVQAARSLSRCPHEHPARDPAEGTFEGPIATPALVARHRPRGVRRLRGARRRARRHRSERPDVERHVRRRAAPGRADRSRGARRAVCGARRAS